MTIDDTSTTPNPMTPLVPGRGGSVPSPDPTRLTTEQLYREISSLRDSHVRDLASLRELIEARLDGGDKAVRLLQVASDAFPARIDEKIEALREIHNEKFNSIQTQFRERDVRTEQSSKDSKVAVDAALQAAKEAVGEQNKSSSLAISKSETGTTKQIDQLGGLISQLTKGFDDKNTDLKDRLTRLEGMGIGERRGVGTSAGVVASAIGFVIAIAAIIVSVLVRKP